VTSTQRQFFHQTIVRSFLLFLPVAALCITGASILYQSELETIVNKIHSDENNMLTLTTSSTAKVVQLITNDLAYLASQRDLIDVISHLGKPEYTQKKENNSSNWLTFSQIKKTYDQIRWLDKSGQERERINYNDKKSIRVPDEKLQNKAKRYYFTDTYKLNRGEFFISPMDLNIEKGHIEKPLKPTIRVGTPIFSKSGEKMGIILLNYFAEIILNEYATPIQIHNANSQPWLVNNDGYWLRGSSTELEWGFMYQNSQATMPHIYPQAWEKISASTKGQFIDDNGLWTFSTIYPLVEGQKTSTGSNEAFLPSRSMLESQKYFWKAILFLPQKYYQVTYSQVALPVIIVTVILLIISYIGCFFLARAWIKEKNSEKNLIQLNSKLESTVEDRTKQLLLAKKQAEDLADIDELTGMNNRRSFFKQGRIISEQAIRYGLQYTVMMLDIDWFKKVNDSYGHLIGDEALKDVAKVIKEGIRAPDISGRIGGEEFAIILPQTTMQKTLEIAERLRKAVKKITIPVEDHEQVTLTISIGIGQYGEDSQTLHEVLDIADKALYQAKDQGRNQVMLYKV